MPNKMLIDASHPEETRVVVVRGNRIEEFDFESQDKKQLKGNIYLARVTRVEPSLQAAFIEYGGNRHGFLAFSEIHPDYYQIPLADRQALLRAEAEDAEDEDDENGGNDDHQDRNRGRRRRRGGRNRGRNGDDAQHAAAQDANEASATDDNSTDDDTSEVSSAEDDTPESEQTPDNNADDNGVVVADQADATESQSADEPTDEASSGSVDISSMAMAVEADVISEPLEQPAMNEIATEGESESSDNDRGNIEQVSPHHEDDQGIESVGAEDALEEVRNRRKPPRRHYKIQEVIKRRQILLVQVVKEERGNKGAALTTYLSLAGRYSVLMPNTARGGGISRKITNAQDRKRLKEVVQDLEVPQGMGVILRTAGESRTKAEIKRDYEYLMRLWETVRNLTLQSTAPALVYEEGSLIKRSVRDLYNKDIDEVLVSGEDGYREAKDFMRMLMPSHAKVVQPYRDTTPIFVRSGIEAQLDRMLQPQVTLKSGGYIIINQTEALVAIDVNSGRSTKEHSIEETALHTNLEAAEEVARQLRLRDLAGLIVIDFIDMEENRNNRAVEKRLKDHLKNDRARIQVGRISHFGLMEMSRQRIRSSVLESTMKPCPHCSGTGNVRSDSSVALLVVRAIEEFLLKDSRHHITVRTPVSTALYVLNHKRHTLVELEQRFGLTINIEPDDSVGLQHYAIARDAVAEKPLVQAPPLVTPAYPDEVEDEIVEDEATEEAEAEASPVHTQKAEDGEHGDRKRRKRRRRRGGRDREQHVASEEGDANSEAQAVVEGTDNAVEDEAEAVSSAAASVDSAGEADDAERKKRRRGKRGGRRNRKEEGETVQTEAAETGEDAAAVAESAEAEQPVAVETEPAPSQEPVETPEPAAVVEEAAAEVEPVAEKPKRAPRRTAKAKKTDADAVSAAAEQAPAEAKVETEAPKAAEKKPAKPRATRRKTKEPAPEVEAAEPPAPAPEPESEPEPLAATEANGAVVPEPAAQPAEEAQAEPEQPKKSGWWQRKSFF
ncbi:Rne/Rng family ribonuclease [Pseudaminobacter sp. NGMCC 1.201702]|uniref:Rne/Rng family ribonuclease n=1 Tax=Pseudaminobacter sp. NGMCC 1.201702 TaxID=3391825 RepID=UPI0039EE5EFA